MRSRDLQDLIKSEGRVEDKGGLATLGHSADMAQATETKAGAPLRSAECGAHRGRPPGDVDKPEQRHFDGPAVKNCSAAPWDVPVQPSRLEVSLSSTCILEGSLLLSAGILGPSCSILGPVGPFLEARLGRLCYPEQPSHDETGARQTRAGVT